MNPILRYSDTPALRYLFDWVLPEKWRSRRAPQPEINDAVLARLSDYDPVYRALMDQALDGVRNAMLRAMERKQTAEERAYHCGQAAALVEYVIGIENWATGARTEKARMAKQSTTTHK